MSRMNMLILGRLNAAPAAILIGFLLFCTVPGTVAEAAGPPAVVAEIVGTALLHPDGDPESKSLSQGSAINPWDTVSTQDKTRLFLTWDNGLKVSLGEFSSLLYSTDEDANGPTNEVQIIEGVVRVATGENRGRDTRRFFVSTPLAYVEPADVNEPVDFVVEVYDPSKTVVTVISGRVRIKGPEGKQWTEKTVLGCKTVFIEEGKPKIMILSAGADDLERLIAATTISGTLRANMDACRPSIARGPVGPEPPVAYSYPDYPEYYEEVWDVVEFPYWDIRVGRLHGGYCEIWIPGAGYFLMPIPAYSGWVFDPTVVEVYARYAFCERALLYDRYSWRNLWMRRRELHNMIVLARQAGNMNLLMQLNRELDYLSVRADWAGRRIHRLEGRIGELQEKRKRFSGQLPRGFNLFQTVSDSFNSQKNLKVMQKFQTQIRNRMNLQNQLAGVAGKDIASLRNRISRERDPGKRMALRSELGKIKKQVAEGRLPLAGNQKELRNLLTQAGKGGDADRQAQARRELLTRLEKQKGAPQADLVNQKTLAEVKQAVDRKTNPRTRQRLERRIGELERSVEQRKQGDAQLKRIEKMTVEAATETDPNKRKEILGTLRDLSKPPSGAGAPPGLNFIQQRQNLERQLGDVKDKARRDVIQSNIEDLKRKQEEQSRQHRLEQERRVRQPAIQDGDHTKQPDLKRLREEQGRKATEQRLREQQERNRRPEIGRKQQEDEGKRQAEQRLRDQQERNRQSEMRRKQQDEGKRQAEQRLKEQQERAHKADILRQQQEKQRGAVEQRAREQQERARRAEQARQQQLRQQKERARQTDMLRQQQEQQRRATEQRARQQQDRARQADQARQQQLRQQQERARQAEQARQQQMRRQQIQQQQQHQQQRQQQIRRQQEGLKKKLEQKTAPK